jgi:hypothetical protein
MRMPRFRLLTTNGAGRPSRRFDGPDTPVTGKNF